MPGTKAANTWSSQSRRGVWSSTLRCFSAADVNSRHTASTELLCLHTPMLVSIHVRHWLLAIGFVPM